MPHLVRRILLLALAGGVLYDVLVPGNAAGVNAPLVMAAFLAVALLVGGRDGLGRMDPADAWLAPAALGFAGLTVLRSDDWLVTADLFLAACLAAGFVGCLGGGRITRGAVPRILELAVGAVVAAVIGVVSLVEAGRRADRESRDTMGPVPPPTGWPARIRRATPVVRGLLIALPVAAVFVVLFASADAVFERLAADLFAWRPDVDLGDIAARTIVVTIVAWGAAGLLGLAAGLVPALAAHAQAPSGAVSLDDARPSREAPSATTDSAEGAGAPPPPPTAGAWRAGPALGQASAAAAWTSPGHTWAPGAPAWSADRAPSAPLRLGSTEAATILVVIDLVFAVFVGLQLAYLFGGHDTAALAGMTYADYARRGFFELVLVAGLAGLLVVTLDLAVSVRSRAQLAGALLLLGLTAVVLASAFLRLKLYQEAYGWTELRLIVLTAIGWMAVALAIAASLLATRRTSWVLHALGVLALVTLGGLNVVGPQRLVTEQNIARAVDPTLVAPGGRTGLDAGYLVELGDEAVVPVVEAWSRLGTAERGELARVLEIRRAALATDLSLQGWPAWNLTRDQARAALRDWEAAQGR